MKRHKMNMTRRPMLLEVHGCFVCVVNCDAGEAKCNFKYCDNEGGEEEALLMYLKRFEPNVRD